MCDLSEVPALGVVPRPALSHNEEDVMPSHTPSERRRRNNERPVRATQRRRNAQKGKRTKGVLERGLTRGLDAITFGGASKLLSRLPGGRSRSMSSKFAKGLLAPRNSPPMSSFENTGGISGRSLHGSDHG